MIFSSLAFNLRARALGPLVALFACSTLGAMSGAMAQTQGLESALAPVPGPRLNAALYSSEMVVQGNQVVKSVNASGSVSFGDQAEPGASVVQTTRYMSYSSPDSVRRAQQERDYWARQAEALKLRQAERTRDQERYRDARQADLARAQALAEFENTHYWRPVVGLRNFPPVTVSGVQPVYSGSPGLAGTSIGFLSSGFAGRR
jgi:hypothetical protein